MLYTADIAILKPCIDDATRERFSKINTSAGSGVKRYKSIKDLAPASVVPAPYVRDVDLNFTLDRLQRAQVIDKSIGAYRLTPLGKVIAIFSRQPYFLTESVASSVDDSVNYDEDYVKLSRISLDHQKIVQSYIMRRF